MNASSPAPSSAAPPPIAWLSRLRLRLLRVDRTTLLLLVAVVTGLLAALAARQYLVGHAAALEASQRPEQVLLVVAKSDLPAGTVLGADVLAQRDIPRPWAQSLAVRPDEFARVEGQRLGQPLRAGEMLMWSHLEARKSASFSARVANGRRAVTVPVDEVNSISGLLEPGDRIDVYATLDRAGHRQTLAVLTHVRVLATGQRATDEGARAERRLYTTVTLDLDPQQAQNLLLARESGRITALLRNPGDTTSLPDVPADFAGWLRPQAPAQGPAARPLGVPVLYGGRSSPPPAPDALTLLARTLESAREVPAGPAEASSGGPPGSVALAAPSETRAR